MSTVNLVKYYFHKTMYPQSEERLRKIIALAYQTARDRKIYPKAVFIRYVYVPSTSLAMKSSPWLTCTRMQTSPYQSHEGQLLQFTDEYLLSADYV